MKTVEYAKDGLLVSDWDVMVLANLFITSDDECIKVSNALFIDAVRILIKEDKISHEQIQFKFKDEILKPNKDARLERWPVGFCDAHSIFLARLV